MPTPVAAEVTLSESERARLEAWARRPNSAQSLAQRSRIVLVCSEGLSSSEVARRLSLTVGTVRKWRSRFLADRLDGLLDEPRPGRPRTISDDPGRAGHHPTLESAPRDATHWSTRSMAAEVGLSQSAVSRIWRAFGLQPHRQESWKLSQGPAVRGQGQGRRRACTWTRRSGRWCCAWTRSPRSRHWTAPHPSLPMLPGTPQRATHDYQRTAPPASTPPWTSPPAGHRRHCTPATAQSSSSKFLTTHRPRGSRRPRRAPGPGQRLHPQDPGDPTLAGRPPPLRSCTSPRPPSSWLNLVERWFSELTTKKLQRGTHRSVRALNADIRDWIDTWNDNPRPYVWTKTSDQILESIGRYCAANYRLRTLAERRHPVGDQPGAGVTGLLRMELGRPQRTLLDGGDEPVAAVLGPGDQPSVGRRPARRTP